MFVVIFLEQWLKEKTHTASLLGVGLSVGCLLLFGADRFLLPTMVAILLSLTVLWRVLDREVAS
jgi:4-azaleucine resistance transporter AzlC